MCLLGVSMMNNHIYGSKVPQNPHFGGLNRHFKPTMQKIQIALSSDLCIRLTWNLTGSCGQRQRLRGWSRMVVKRLQDGGQPPFWKSLYRHISVKNHPILMKFCTQQQILTGLPCGLNFNAHTHPISTEKPCLMHISFYFLSCMPSVCIIIVCTQYCTVWCMNIIIQYVQIKLSLTVYT